MATTFLMSACSPGGYTDPFRIFLYKRIGIVAPATPGRYRIAVSQASFPEPVESELYTLPCSNISDARLKVSAGKKHSQTFSVSFKTGEGGALDKRGSSISILMPNTGSQVTSIPHGTVSVNGESVTEEILLSHMDGQLGLVIRLPADIDGNSDVTINFAYDNVNLLGKLMQKNAKVSTSSEPQFEDLVFQESQVSTQTVILRPEEMIYSDMFMVLRLEGRSYPAKSDMSFFLPKGFQLPLKPKVSEIEVDGYPHKADFDIDKNMITCELSIPISNFAVVGIPKECGIANPKFGEHEIVLKIAEDVTNCGKFTIHESKPEVFALSLSNPQATKQTSMAFTIKPSYWKPLSTMDSIIVTFPQGTDIPGEIKANEIKIDGSNPSSVKVECLSIRIGIGKTLTAQHFSKIKTNAKIGLPRNHRGFKLTIATSKREAIDTEPFDLTPAPLVSNIHFKDPGLPSAGEWFNKAPLVGIDCLNPEASVFYWLNNRESEKQIYKGEFRMTPDTQQTSITVQATYSSQTETPHSMTVYIDETKPKFTIVNPSCDGKFTNKKAYPMTIVRESSPFVLFGNRDDNLCVDDVFVELRGYTAQIANGRVFEKIRERYVDYKLSCELRLSEGENVVVVTSKG